MGYTKKWTPPTIPLRDNLTAWKTLFNDVHDNLIAAGLVQTATAGQLIINDVASLPADNTFAGFIEYAFDDALQSEAPVIIKIEYGCGIEGLRNGASYTRARTPRIKTTVTFKGANVAQFQCPQQSSGGGGNITTQLTAVGHSLISLSYSNGFFGISYGVGSRNKPFADATGSYHGATLTLFIQRQLNENGTPVSTGLAIYTPSLAIDSQVANLWSSGVLELSKSSFSNGSSSVTRTDMSPRVGRDGFAGGVDSVLLEPIYFPTNPPTPFPYLYSYQNTAILAGTEFEFNSVIGDPLNFVAIGNETCMSIDSIDGQRAGLAMLFE